MFKKACDIATESIVITNIKGDIIYVNPSCCELSGYSREELIGQNPRIFKSGLQKPDIYRDLWKTISSGKTWHGEFANKKKDGTIYWEKVAISPFVNDGQQYYVAVKENITILKKLEEKSFLS